MWRSGWRRNGQNVFTMLQSLPLTDWIGYLAAILTTGSFIPQAALTLRTRDVSGISLGMYGAFTFGVALWLLYGLRLGEWPIVAANALTLLLASVILVTKIATDRRATRRKPG
jgi:MtN3 and saliva related transmembrane protein